MQTFHKFINCNSNNVKDYIKNNSVSLVVTSPPYPMVEMWDNIFSKQNPLIEELLKGISFDGAFIEMHNILDKVWEEVDRVLCPNGIVCINIGDAVRNCKGLFKVFSNHTRIIEKFQLMGYSVLPDIIWRKPVNSPNKFLGSGMLPSNAYITYEHEYILVFRKGGCRKFNELQKDLRSESAYFWEERNIWFSDLWTLTGIKQNIKEKNTRERSAAFPFELAYRLINMFSIKGDIIYDPFMGTGTVSKASMASERNSYSIDIDRVLCVTAIEELVNSKEILNKIIKNRIETHNDFIKTVKQDNLYTNIFHNFNVKTKQEINIKLYLVKNIMKNNDVVICDYVEGGVKNEY